MIVTVKNKLSLFFTIDVLVITKTADFYSIFDTFALKLKVLFFFLFKKKIVVALDKLESRCLKKIWEVWLNTFCF